MTGWTGPEAEALAAYELAAGSFVELVGRVALDRPDGGWDRPGLGEWDLRALVGHAARALVTVTTYLGQTAARDEVPSAAAYVVRVGSVDAAAVAERGRQAGTELGDDPYGWVREAADRAFGAAAASDPARLIPTVAGGIRVAAYLPTRTFELVVHTLDVAAATGLRAQVADEALTAATRLAAEVALASGGGPALLAALTGRGPWSDDLVVVR